MKDRDHIHRIKCMPCVVCNRYPPNDAHHCIGHMFKTGTSKRSSDYCAIPLCKKHHQDGNFGEAIHAGQRTFEKNHGYQIDLLERTLNKLYGEEKTKEFIAKYTNKCII